LVRELGGLYQFNILGAKGGTWIMDLRSGSGRITAVDAPVEKPDVVLTMTVENMKTIFQGGISAFNAYMQELLTVDGDLKMAMNLEVIIERMKRRRMLSDAKNTGDKSGVFIV
jgi:putative sterol carrier protein